MPNGEDATDDSPSPVAAEEAGEEAGEEAASSVPGFLQPYLKLPTTVHLLCLGSFVNRAGSFVFIFLTIYISEQLGYGVQFAANCFGVFGLGSIVSSLAGGQLADRFGRKPVMLFALYGAAALLVLLGLIQHKWIFLFLILILSLCVEMYRPAASAMMGDLVGPDERPLAFGLMYIAFNLGFAVAAPIGGLLAERSFQLLFFGDALTTALYGTIILLFVRETLPSKAEAALDTNLPQRNVRAGWAEAIAYMKTDITFQMFAVACLLTSVVFMQAFSTLPIYLNQLGYSKEHVGWLLATNGILIVFCQIPVTQLMNRFHRVLVICLGEILIAIGFGLTTFAETSLMFLLTIVVWTMGEVVQAAFKQSFVADLAPAEMRGRYMGVFSLCHAVGLSFGAPLGGRVLQRLGPTALWSGCFVVVAIASVIYFLVYLRLNQQKAQATSVG